MLIRATAAANAAGITDPRLRADAIFDYVATGDPRFLTEARQAELADLVPDPAVVVAPGPAGTVQLVGIQAASATLTEAASGSTTATFQVYRTGDTSAPLALTYAVQPVAGASSYTAADFGGTLPAGSVIIPAGAAEASFSIAAPGLDGPTDKLLRVAITPPPNPGVQLVPGSATVDIVNNGPVAGAAAIPGLLALSGGVVSGLGTAFTLDLGALPIGSAATARLGVANLAPPGSNELAAAAAAAAGDPTVSSSALSVADILAGSYAAGLTVSVANVATGVHSATIVLRPTQENVTGFTGTLPDVTLTVTYTGAAPPAPPEPPIVTSYDGAGSALTGTAPAGSIVTLRDGATAIGQTTADGMGAFTVAFGALGDGTHVLTTTATVGGVVSAPSGAITFLPSGASRNVSGGEASETPAGGPNDRLIEGRGGDDTLVAGASATGLDRTHRGHGRGRTDHLKPHRHDPRGRRGH